MKWLRRTPTTSETELDDVAATLTAAAQEAPPSTGAEAIRDTLLASLDAEGRQGVGLGPVALAGSALVLAIAIAVGGPMVSSFIGTVREGVLTSPPAPSPLPPTQTLATATPRPEIETATPSPSVTSTGEPSPTPSPTPSATPEPTDSVTAPAPSSTIPPQASPGGPPDPMPTPPRTGPPPAVP